MSFLPALIAVANRSPQSRRPKSRSLKLAVLGAITALMFLGIFISVSITPTTPEDFETVRSTLVLLSVVGILGVIAAAAVFRWKPETEKAKRQGTDVYTQIDRFVNELDDEEAAYLQQQLDQREGSLVYHYFADDADEGSQQQH